LAVADRLHVPYDDALAHEKAGAGWLERVLSGFVGSDTGAPAPLLPDTFSSEDFRRATEEVLLQQAQTGEGVILGRGAVVVLRSSEPGALRVRLDGPAQERARQAMRLDPGLDAESAERARAQFDRTHAAYLRQFYDVDVSDAALYHLALDSTAIEFDVCVELIARAAEALRLAPAGGSPFDRGQR
jgi:cytidylate kinase